MPFVKPAQKQKFRAPKAVIKPIADTQTFQTQAQTQTQNQSNGITPLGQKPLNVVEACQDVHALLRYSLSSICYLRQLLPDDNFEDLTIARQGVPESGSAPNSRASGQSVGTSYGSSSKKGKGLKIKHIRPGVSQEGNLFLKWIDEGVMDAIGRKYLRSMMLLIYLDPNNPDQVVETYTYNFTYNEEGMATFHVTDNTGRLDVSSDAATVGYSGGLHMAPQTRDDTELALKRMMRKIIMMVQMLIDLPERKFMNIKLFYTDDTPEDYEPPAFAEDELSEVFAGTHSVDEAPITYDGSGKFETGHHEVKFQVTSVAHCLPPSEAKEAMTGNQESAADAAERYRLEKIADNQLQEEDMERRDILWPVETSLYPQTSGADDRILDSLATVHTDDIHSIAYPYGQRLPDGTIVPIPKGKKRWQGREGDEDAIHLRATNDETGVQVVSFAKEVAYQYRSKRAQSYDDWAKATQDSQSQSIPQLRTQPGSLSYRQGHNTSPATVNELLPASESSTSTRMGRAPMATPNQAAAAGLLLILASGPEEQEDETMGLEGMQIADNRDGTPPIEEAAMASLLTPSQHPAQSMRDSTNASNANSDSDKTVVPTSASDESASTPPTSASPESSGRALMPKSKVTDGPQVQAKSTPKPRAKPKPKPKPKAVSIEQDQAKPKKTRKKKASSTATTTATKPKAKEPKSKSKSNTTRVTQKSIGTGTGAAKGKQRAVVEPETLAAAEVDLDDSVQDPNGYFAASQTQGGASNIVPSGAGAVPLFLPLSQTQESSITSFASDQVVQTRAQAFSSSASKRPIDIEQSQVSSLSGFDGLSLPLTHRKKMKTSRGRMDKAYLDTISEEHY